MNPYQPPQQGGLPTGLPPDDREKLREVAKAQRYINLEILGYIGAGVVLRTLQGVPGGQILGGLVGLAVVLAGCVFIVQMARALYNTGVAVLCAILLFIPCVGLLTLLIVNNRATARLQAAGIKVGLLGAEPGEVDRVLGSQ
jgi:hypothetical protein